MSATAAAFGLQHDIRSTRDVMVGSYNAGVPLLRNVMIADAGLPLYRPSMLRGRLESARDDA